ncbi:tetratricopeptide repeat-containing protein [Bacillus sp. GBSW19]|uniref:response regulator aspartate phosphatase n=1 Tax=unclassified Bacillus (in: firmicutes) TaxID=185979 RepID=UPI000D02EF65|nr:MULTISPECIES: tetratricopeptide repeat protein [unclassified Bacillus (in: firmicutes)]PRS61144.1 tetratricopeptide repeat-containing protein [Bacillus sp. GBSW19]PRS77161.1 tetratricopeptide repeat-containing protein [Bacillus sp. LNXM65]
MSKIPVAELASLLNDWNMEIKKDHADEAERLFAKAKQAVEEIDDADILMYYSLLEKRHHILMYNLRGQKGSVSTRSIEGHHGKKEDDLSNRLAYYFDFYEGVYEQHQGNYEVALQMYQSAEKLLDKIPSEIERADFDFKVAWLYYRLSHIMLSLSYIRRALHVYKRHKHYERRTALSYSLIAANQTEIGRYEEALENYRLAEEVLTSEQDDFMLAQLHHNVAILYSFWNKPKESIRHLEKALSHQEYYESDFFFHSTYLISRELCVIGEKQRASQYIEAAYARIKDASHEVFQLKIGIVHDLYLTNAPQRFQQIDEKLRKLEEKHEYHEVKELSHFAAKYCEKQALYEQSVFYLNKSLEADLHMKRMGLI